MIYVPKCAYFKLEQSWKSHKKADRLLGLPPASANLLLFYAVECGLKFLLLKTRNLAQCPRKGDLFYSHDLVRILMATSPARAEVGTAPSSLRLNLGSGKKRYQGVRDVHLVWRYGLPLDSENEKDVIDWLRKVSQYIVSKRGMI